MRQHESHSETSDITNEHGLPSETSDAATENSDIRNRSGPFFEIFDIRDNTIVDDLRELSRTYQNPWDATMVETTCLHTYPSLADFALDEYHDPDLYLADITIINNKIVWRKPNYATYGKPTKLTIPPNYTTQTIPNPHILSLDQDDFHFFILRYLQAWREIHFWQSEINSEEWEIQCGPREKALVQQSIDHWVDSVDAIILNPYFESDWPIPAFYQWYSADLKTMSAYYTSRIKSNQNEYGEGTVHCGCFRNHHTSTKSFETRVYTEIDAWKVCTENFFLLNGAPFTKCLWMHTAILEAECYFTSDECTEAGRSYYRNLQTRTTRTM